jgi:hypothetical protein
MPSRSSEPPKGPVFFIDRDLGRRFPAILREAGITVEVHDDHYPGEDKPADHEWLEMIAQRGWVAVSHDANIRHTSRSRQAIEEGGARLIVVKGRAKTAELAQNFVRTYPAIGRFVQQHQGPWIAKLYRPPARGNVAAGPGRIELWWPTSD